MDKPQKLTPMLKQYFELKEKHSGCILFFRLGDFYEMFGADALEASKILSLTLTSRGQDETKIPMCGIPYHAAKRYIGRLTKLGKSVAICEQLSDPNLPGIVERDVVRIITPGTTFDDYLLDEKTNNFIAAITLENEKLGFAFCDITTGEFQCIDFHSFTEAANELTKIKPAEIIIPSRLINDDRIKIFFSQFPQIFLTPINQTEDPYEYTLKHFGVKSLDGFGIENQKLSISAAANLIEYLKNTQKNNLSHIKSIKTYNVSQYMVLDESTISNLEIFYTMRENKKEGSLINVIDQTLTAMGGRMLKLWLLKPLKDKKSIEYRLNGVRELFDNFQIKAELIDVLKNILDIERILGRIGCNHGNARDLLALRESLKKTPIIKNLLQNFKSEILQNIQQNLYIFDKLTSVLDKALLDEPSAQTKEGGMIKEGFNSNLDDLRSITTDSKTLIQQLQEQEIQRTGIQSLKVRFNGVFGYYIEISRANLNKVPSDYMRRQTLVNAERFITPELKEYEEKVLGAEEKIIELEFNIFIELKNLVLSEIEEIQKNAKLIAMLDIILSFAETASKKNYIMPEITDSKVLEITNGRHPVIEALNFSNDFISNNTYLDDRNKQIALITGPNMAGKSTYLRQTALIVLLAHIGSFIPADKGCIPVTDRIFTRVGASDNLTKGQSTFMVEMQEAANIINNATNSSLIILDEIGRGTSTYDGLSIAWAIFEYIHDKIQAKTLFATHYHELIDVAEKFQNAFNLSVAVEENEDGVVFLHKVITGGIDKSYGIEVAKLAGLPKDLTNRANEILSNLEQSPSQSKIIKIDKNKKKEDSKDQLDLFNESTLREHAVLKKLKTLDINTLTPIEALNKLVEIQKSIETL